MRQSMRLLWPRLTRFNILTQLTQLCLLPVCVDQWHDTIACLKSNHLDRRDGGGSGRWRELSYCWAESFCLRGKMTEQSTKLKLYVAFVKLNVVITEAARVNAKHPTERSPRLDGRQPTLHDFSRKLTRPVREKVTNAVAVWVAGDCRPINIVEDGGLTEVIKLLQGTILMIYR